MDLGLTDKVVLVCAGSKGLGLASAIELAREGAQVAICGRTQQTLNEAVKAINSVAQTPSFAVQADVSSTSDLDRLVAEVVSQSGRTPDIVVWNGGGPPAGSLLEVAIEDLNDGIRLHMQGALHLFKATIPNMHNRGFGRVIAVTSIAVRQPLATLGISNGIRAGLHGFLKTLALEAGHSGVTVNAILPGYTETDRIKDLARTKSKSSGITEEEFLAGLASEIPAQRLGQPHEFGAAVAFLASVRASYINGVSLQVDGGFCRGLL